MDSEINLMTENWRSGDWDETQNGAHIMRRKGCAMQNQGITLKQSSVNYFMSVFGIGFLTSPFCINHYFLKILLNNFYI